jgi:hypothetical protein
VIPLAKLPPFKSTSLSCPSDDYYAKIWKTIMDDPYIESILSLAQRYTELIENEYQFIHHNRVLSNQGDNGGSNQHIFNSELTIHEANEILDKYQTLLMDMIHVQPFIPVSIVCLITFSSEYTPYSYGG